MCQETYTNMLIHGYNCEFKIIKPSKKLILVGEELNKLRSKVIRLEIEELTVAKAESEDFLKSHFNIHPIFYANNSELDAELAKYDFKNIYQVKRIYKKQLRKIDPYQLPILIDENSDYRHGKINEICPNSQNKKLFKIIHLANENIVLGKTTTNCTGSIITHEITHSQINYHKGNVKSYYNQEVLSIFLQLVHNLEKSEKDLEIDKFFRLLEIEEAVRELTAYHESENFKITDDLFNTTKYLESTLKAFLLFEVYLESSNKIKKDILSYIQKIFDGKKSLEELLAKYNITLQRSSKLLQKQYLGRK